MTVGLITADDPQTSAGSQAIHRRLLAVHDALGMSSPRHVQSDPGSLLEALVEHAAQQPTAAETWLLIIALTGHFPDQAEVLETRRKLELLPTDAAIQYLLLVFQMSARQWGSTLADLELVTDRVVVDVNYSARYTHLTGVQRVVRETARLWKDDHDVELVVWNQVGGAFRRLTNAELRRLDDRDKIEPDSQSSDGDEESVTPTVVVPWGAPVILLEVPIPAHGGRLAAMAEFSPSPIRMVGYDCIPAVSADLVPDAEPEKFGRYVELLKFSERVATISQSAAEEFGGLVSALSAQGLAGPSVSACPLPTESDLGAVEASSGATPDKPVVLCIGTIGPRKNQASVLLAAELLWRKGIEFELRLLGHTSWTGELVSDLIQRAESAGRPLVIERRATDQRLAESLAESRCMVFPSLHEGFGLPVVEALSAGVPVVTSNHGSLQEIAEGGGALVVDAEDAPALAEAIQNLLLDDDLHARLVAEAQQRPVRTWSDYAAALWEELGA